jgi:protein-S-isoprenylcysteine O-methyltransferase Ste14
MNQRFLLFLSAEARRYACEAGNKTYGSASMDVEDKMNSTSMERADHQFKRDIASGEHPKGDLGQVICLAAFLVLWILDSFVFRVSTFLAGFVPLPVRLAIAGLVCILAVYLIRAAHDVISDESFRDRRLIRTGVFARLRHPLYGGSLLFYLSLVFTTSSLLSLAALGGIFVFYDFIASYEETLLEREYGTEYQDYRKRVPKWLPRLKKARFD